LDDYQSAVNTLDCFAKLRAHTVTVYHDTLKDVDALTERLAVADAVVLIRERTRITAALVERLPRLKLICQTGGSVSNIDVAACTRSGIAVACALAGTANYSWTASHASAEFAWALILAAMRGVVREAAELRAGRWQTVLGVSVRDRILGIFGYGKIGAQVARFGREFGMQVLAWGRAASLARARDDGIETASSQRELFERADVLSLHATLSDTTRGIVRRDDLLHMKRSALIVNTSRAALIEPGALVEALRAGRPGSAAVDVYEDEPVLNGEHPLLKMDNVLCTPHMAFVERDSYERSFNTCFTQIAAFMKGRPIDIINQEVLSRS
jgi:D-3-phosphoglycerate dehydrogenase